MKRKITIDPVTRVNGRCKITLFLDKKGGLDNAYFQTIAWRDFEGLCRGQPAEEMPRITPRICGLSSWAHHLASAKAVDSLWDIKPSPAADKMRRLMHHIAHFSNKLLDFYYLNAADFIVGSDSKTGKRNLMASLEKLGEDTGADIADTLLRAQIILRFLGGKTIHPVASLPGRVSKGISEKDRGKIEEKIESLIAFASFSSSLFEEIVLKNQGYLDLLLDEEPYHVRTHYMSLVDEKGYLDLYDGKVKIVDPKGEELFRFSAKDHFKHITEHREPWTNTPFHYLRRKGWKGFLDGEASGVYRVGSLARLNVSDKLKTPQAQEAYERMQDMLPKPCHNTLAFHWANIIELIYSAERALELVCDPEITGEMSMNAPGKTPEEGVGVVESPSGTLIHHYSTDKRGIIEKARITTASNQNNAAIYISVKKAAEKLIKEGNVSKSKRNMIEMACRAYSPSFPGS